MLWFDLDDTLWDMTGNSVICLRQLYETRSLDRYFDSPQQWDEVYHRINASLWEQYGRAEITRDFLRSERFARPLRLAGVDAAEADAMSAEFDTYYLQLLGSKTGLVDGAREALVYLRGRGYRMAIVSNGFHEVQYNKLRSSHIDGFFDLVVLSDDAGYNKPDARFFRYAERQAATEGSLNVIVGDNPVADIRGAIDAGWNAVWFDPSHSADTSVVDEVSDRGRLTACVSSLSKLRDIF